MDDKLTTKEAITVLRNLQDWLYFSAMNGGTSIQREAIDMAIGALKQYEPHWIPVTEDTLPEENRVVVVCGEKGTWDYGMYRGFLSTNVHLWNWKGNTLKKVYWWMYKEDALAMPYEE